MKGKIMITGNAKARNPFVRNANPLVIPERIRNSLCLEMAFSIAAK